MKWKEAFEKRNRSERKGEGEIKLQTIKPLGPRCKRGPENRLKNKNCQETSIK